ncbi:cbb3-type cytochrome c oxidase subunit I [Halorussus gelatinilyticus]|uniref:Cbb3-type cytochrome c oxidase subunit I n=1 Tax=Halorussus gelatinilyticus TaxID=2937524 RepID=A0A8U0ILF1_9EURY|nr:DUF6789 family protein [Halorussus gelatinilyticus]UPW00869.1 cbb3-type cytochrome c oxidase subunit I [Halorussus gelatinilyticus]
MNGPTVEFAALCLVVLSVGALARHAKRRARADGGEYPGREGWFDAEALTDGVVRWTTTTNHRDVGLLYIAFGTFAALWGGIDGMMIRTELLTPPADIWTESTYNALFTTHGLTMLFFFVTPVFFGIGNYFIPLLVDAEDMAFPRVNAIGFWLLPPALLLARAGLLSQVSGQFLGLLAPDALAEVVRFFESIEAPGVGWTMYTPLSITVDNPQMDLLLLGLHLSGIGTVLGAINFVVTIVYERGPSIEWETLDIFSWTMLTTSGLVIFAFPLLGSALVMLLLDRNFGTTFFTVEGGGPLLWQHLFWYFGHPEVYIIFLPATGLMSFILPKFARRALFGFKYIVYSTLAIGVLSFGVWAHHMFATGIDPRIRASFMFVSIAIAVPSAIKVFNWLTTIWDGTVRLTAPMVLCVSSIGMFVVGGVTGVFLAAIPVDLLYHGTYYVVGHFHFIVMGIIPLMMFAASYFWYPIITGRLYDRELALFQSVLLVFGAVVAFGSLVVLGFMELPRRHAVYPEMFAPVQQVATVGAFLVGISVLLWLYNMIWSAWNGTPVRSADVWNLKETEQFTREWEWFEEELERKYAIEPTEPETTRSAAATEPGEGSPQVLTDVTSVTGAVRDNAAVAALGGLVGTLLLSGVLFPATIIGVFDLASFADLSELVGLPRSIALGYGLFLAGGMTTWALLFVALASYLPGRVLVVRGLSYATIVAAGFLVAFYSGQSGLELVGFVVFTLVAHWLYGFGLAATIQAVSLRGVER